MTMPKNWIDEMDVSDPPVAFKLMVPVKSFV